MKKHDNIIVVLGGGGDTKPHAARAKAADENLARKAAEAMQYVVGVAKTSTAQAIARKLPEIRLFQTGRALVPRVKPELYDQLTSVLSFTPRNGHVTAELATEADDPKHLKGVIPNPWAEIDIGSLVLAPDEVWSGWFEAFVVGIESKGRLLILQWRDWPNQKRVAFPRTAVALPPSARPTTTSPESQRASDETPQQ